MGKGVTRLLINILPIVLAVGIIVITVAAIDNKLIIKARERNTIELTEEEVSRIDRLRGFIKNTGAGFIKDTGKTAHELVKEKGLRYANKMGTGKEVVIVDDILYEIRAVSDYYTEDKDDYYGLDYFKYIDGAKEVDTLRSGMALECIEKILKFEEEYIESSEKTVERHINYDAETGTTYYVSERVKTDGSSTIYLVVNCDAKKELISLNSERGGGIDEHREFMADILNRLDFSYDKAIQK